MGNISIIHPLVQIGTVFVVDTGIAVAGNIVGILLKHICADFQRRMMSFAYLLPHAQKTYWIVLRVMLLLYSFYYKHNAADSKMSMMKLIYYCCFLSHHFRHVLLSYLNQIRFQKLPQQLFLHIKSSYSYRFLFITFKCFICSWRAILIRME